MGNRRPRDTNHCRSLLAERDTLAVIPSTSSRTTPIPFDRIVARGRTLIEHMSGRLKDCRRIATRYDQLATTSSPSSLLRQPASGD